MAYMNGFPATYPQMYPQYQQYIPQMQAQQSSQSSIICEWVQNESAASAMPTPPIGITGIYMDISQPFVYKKEMGTDGKPLPMEVFELTRRQDRKDVSVNEDELRNYVRTDQIEDIVMQKVEDVVRDEIDKRLSEMSFKPTRRTKITEE